MNSRTTFKWMRMAIAVLIVPAAVFAAGQGSAGVADCVRSQILSHIEDANTRPKQVEFRFQALQKACASGHLNICKDGTLTEIQKSNLLHAAAQLDNGKVRNAFLFGSPAKHKSELDRLVRYVTKMREFCNPPIHQICASERWQLVFEDYLARNGDLPNAKYLARWNEDHIETRIPGLADFLQERFVLPEIAQSPEAYKALLESPRLSADSISIISEEAMKKRLNDVNKGFSDALGEMRLRSFRWHLAQALSEQGLELPKATRVDFKTDRLLEPLLRLQKDHPRKLEQAVNRAAAEANEEITLAVQTRFPELMYVADMYEPQRWYNTATFSLPGYSSRLNEALASFKARRMREEVVLSNEAVRDEFVALAKSVIQLGDRLKDLDARNREILSKAGVLEKDGTFTRKAAELIRKLKPGGSLADSIAETFAVKLPPSAEKLLLEQWHAQDMLSLPLMTIDKMPAVPKDVPILGGDGVAGGAIDAWMKVRSLIAYRKAIYTGATPDAQVKQVFNALDEGNSNASVVIRSAPVLLKNAVEAIPAPQLKKLGITQVMTSADDTIAPLANLRMLRPKDRDKFYRKLAWNAANQSRTVKNSTQGVTHEEPVGPEILRIFVGYNKASSEEAEQFLKPIEERLSTAKFLGPKWREQYPDVALFAVQEHDSKVIKLFVAGKSIDDNFKVQLGKVLQATLRSSKHDNVQFVTRPE